MGNYIKKEQDIKQENLQINRLKAKYGLVSFQLDQIVRHYFKIDLNSSGSITALETLVFLREDQDSILRPYLQHLFDKLSKQQDQERLKCLEWVELVCDLCLSTQQNLVKVLFDMLDQDFDSLISKKDIIKFMFNAEKPTFFSNDMDAVAQMEIDRPEQISIDQFRKIIRKIWFLLGPLITLQEKIQKKICGIQFWKEVFEKRQKIQRNNKNANTRDKDQEKRKKQFLQKKSKQLCEKFQKNPYARSTVKDRKHRRCCEQLGSDTMIQVSDQVKQRRTLSDHYIKPPVL